MFNVVMGPDGNIAGAVSGNYITAHEAGRKLVDSIDGANIEKKSDIVIAFKDKLIKVYPYLSFNHKG